MYYEYLLDLNAYFHLDFNDICSCGETVTCWGEDEYDDGYHKNTPGSYT